jgi:Pectate lyase superfamily protein/Glycosyl hydrolases family 28
MKNESMFLRATDSRRKYRHVFVFAAAFFSSLCFCASSQACSLDEPQSHPEKIFNVRQFGATGDGGTLDTPAISKAIQAANAGGGGRVIFPPGVYLSGTFELLSNVTLDIQANAVILGSPNLADYGAISTFGFAHVYGENSTGEGELVGIIVARNAENIAIIGQGVIDGNADRFFDFKKPHYELDFDPQYTRQGKDFLKSMLELGDGPVEMKTTGRPGTMIVFTHSQGIVVRDITFRNAPNWTFHLNHSSRAVIHGIHIVNSLFLPNNDGIDCLACRDVHVSDCDIVAGDDDFAFYGSENIGVTNCSLVSHSAGIRMENTRWATFSDLTIHSNRGIGIFERTGTTANVSFSNIVIETQLLTGHWWGKAEPIFIAVGPPSVGKTPAVHDVHFSHIFGTAEAGMVLYGNEKAWLKGITFDQVRFTIRSPRKQVAQMAGGNFDFRWTAGSLARAVFKHDIPALYLRFVDGMRINDLHLDWEEGLPDYFSNAIECEDFRELSIELFEGRAARADANLTTIDLLRGAGVSIVNNKALPGTGTFLRTEQVSGQGIFALNDLRTAKQAFSSNSTGFSLTGNLMPAKH